MERYPTGLKMMMDKQKKEQAKKIHNHPGKEHQLGLKNHVIIDREFFEELKEAGLAREIPGKNLNILEGD